MAWQLNAIRTALRVLPEPLRERLAVRLFLTARRHRPPPREEEWRSRGTDMEIAGHAAVAFGRPGAPVAFLLHGWEGRGLQLAAFIDPLVAAGHQVLAIDGPGHGRSDGQAALPPYAAMLEQAIEEADPAIIIGHSFGSAAAIVAASRCDFQGHVLCLGGPPETMQIFRRARAFMGMDDDGLPRFLDLLRQRFQDHRFDDLMDIEGCARRWNPGDRLHAVLAREDDDIPIEESIKIVEEGGGTATVLDEVTHRSVMWRPEAVQAGLAGIKIQLVR